MTTEKNTSPLATQQSNQTDTTNNSVTHEARAIAPSPIQLKLVNTDNQQIIDRDGTHYLVWYLTVTGADGKIHQVDLQKEISALQAHVYRLPLVEHESRSISIAAECVIRKGMESFIDNKEIAATTDAGFRMADGKLSWSGDIGSSITTSYPFFLSQASYLSSERKRPCQYTSEARKVSTISISQFPARSISGAAIPPPSEKPSR